MNKKELKYQQLYEMVINNKVRRYDDLVLNAQPNSKNDVDQFRKENIEFLNELNKRDNIETWLQDENPDSDFRYIRLNGERYQKGMNIKYRMYLCPQIKNLHSIIKMIIARNQMIKNNIFLKYSTNVNRTDRLVMYLQDEREVEIQEEILKQMRIDRPERFENMQSALSWIHENKTNPNVYIEKEPRVIGDSYSGQFMPALNIAKRVTDWYTKNKKDNIMSEYEVFKLVLDNQLNQRGIGEKDNVELTSFSVVIHDNKLFSEQILNNRWCKVRMFPPERCMEYIYNINKLENIKNIDSCIMPRKSFRNYRKYPSNLPSMHIIADNLMQIYKYCESKEEFEDRKKHEEHYLKIVLDSIKNKRYNPVDKQGFTELVLPLISAESVTLSEGPNVLGEFIKIPEVTKQLENLSKHKNYEKYKKLLVNATPRPVKETEMQEHWYRAEKFLKMAPEEPSENHERINNSIKEGKRLGWKPASNDNDRISLLKIIALQNGKKLKLENQKDIIYVKFEDMEGISPQKQEIKEENGLNNTRARGWSR